MNKVICDVSRAASSGQFAEALRELDISIVESLRNDVRSQDYAKAARDLRELAKRFVAIDCLFKAASDLLREIACCGDKCIDNCP